MARSTFYYNLKKSKQPEPYLIEKERIKQIYDQHKGRYGYRRITLQLRNEGYLLNQKTVYKLMGELKLKAKIRIKKYRSYKGEIGRIAPNIINREFYCDRPYEKLVTDVTEVKINGVKGYLSPIMDMYNGIFETGLHEKTIPEYMPRYHAGIQPQLPVYTDEQMHLHMNLQATTSAVSRTNISLVQNIIKLVTNLWKKTILNV